jgi:hypothetical protein
MRNYSLKEITVYHEGMTKTKNLGGRSRKFDQRKDAVRKGTNLKSQTNFVTLSH